MRRSVLLLITILIGLATAAALTIAAVTTAHPAVRPPSTRANSELVRRFYGAINQAIATGDISTLDDVVAANFVDREPLPGLPPDRDGLKRYLRTLHQTSPALQVEVSAITVESNWVMARLDIRNAEQATFLDLPLGTGVASWGRVDLFRIAHGRIAERWAVSEGLVTLQPLDRATLMVDQSSRRVMAMHRRTIAPGGIMRHGSTPKLIAVAAGSLAVTVDGASPEPALLARAAAGETRLSEQRIDPGGNAVAVAGDVLVLPEHAVSIARNDGGEPSVVLTFELAMLETFARRTLEEAADEEDATRLPGGGLLADLGAGSHVVSLGRASLAAGATLTFRDPTDPLLIFVESGTVDVANGSDDGSVGNEADGIVMVADEARLAAGDGAFFPPGGRASISAAGADPATVILISVAPAAGQNPDA